MTGDRGRGAGGKASGDESGNRPRPIPGQTSTPLGRRAPGRASAQRSWHYLSRDAPDCENHRDCPLLGGSLSHARSGAAKHPLSSEDQGHRHSEAARGFWRQGPGRFGVRKEGKLGRGCEIAYWYRFTSRDPGDRGKQDGHVEPGVSSASHRDAFSPGRALISSATAGLSPRTESNSFWESRAVVFADSRR